jgi:hypothetical protein
MTPDFPLDSLHKRLAHVRDSTDNVTRLLSDDIVGNLYLRYYTNS